MTSISSKLKTIENKLRKDDNLSGQIDYNEQVAWLLFLKSLDLLEEKRQKKAKFSDKNMSLSLTSAIAGAIGFIKI